MPNSLIGELNAVWATGNYTVTELRWRLRELRRRPGLMLDQSMHNLEAQLAHYKQLQKTAARWSNEALRHPRGDVARLIRELLKTLAVKSTGALESADDNESGPPRSKPPPPARLAALARMLRDVESSEKTHLEVRARLRAEMKSELEEQRAAAAEKLGALAEGEGLSPAAEEKIRGVLLGIGANDG